MPSATWRLRAHLAGAATFIVVASAVSAAPSAAAVTPLTPINLVATDALNGTVTIGLAWEPGTYTTTDPAYPSGYEVERCEGVGCTDFTRISTRTFAFDVDDTGAENTTYSYRVRAFNDAGYSDYTEAVTATTNYLRPGQPTDLAAAYANDSVTLTWVDNATTETEFRVERAEVGVSAAFEDVAILPPDTTSWVDNNVSRGTAYEYRIRPYRFDAFSGTTEVVEVQTGTGTPAPTQMRATATRTNVALSWKTRRPTRVEVWRCDQACEDGTGGWTDLGEFWGSLKIVPRGALSYNDRTVARGTQYVYRIRSVANDTVSPFVYLVARTR